MSKPTNVIVPPSDNSSAPPDQQQRHRLRRGRQALLFLEGLVRLTIWSAAIVAATAGVSAAGLWPERAPVSAEIGLCWRWAVGLCGWVLIFNLVYVVELIALRSLVPTPKPGRYATLGVASWKRELLAVAWISVVNKARYEPPFPGFLVHHVTSLPPMRWVVGRRFGPKSASCQLFEPCILDPHLVQIGHNVLIGHDAIIGGHVQTRDGIEFQRTILEDDVVVGGRAALLSGVHAKAGAMIGAGAIVLPGTVIGPAEFWAGVPARKIRDL